MNERKTDERRDSSPKSPELFTDKVQKAELEARNSLLQFDHILSLVDTSTPTSFRLRPSTLQELQRIVVQSRSLPDESSIAESTAGGEGRRGGRSVGL